ncbi:hypothetical protein FIBSPDRAFT_81505 [Athelia psychrophila]|uniref:Uncharacterized protein n=1 Tax=Athelia psychrophila TaxID=1759441 RepID=A0A166E5R6_9AGAM|nr:hypothetical protein FIBSPDRAFT_81505 [Fibularhizoctonia sp. CBS 109695]
MARQRPLLLLQRYSGPDQDHLPIIQLLVSGILAIWNLFWALQASTGGASCSSRPPWGCQSFLARRICNQQYQAHRTDAVAQQMIAHVFLFYAAPDLLFVPLIVGHIMEIFPYHLRAKGGQCVQHHHLVDIDFQSVWEPLCTDVEVPHMPFLPSPSPLNDGSLS